MVIEAPVSWGDMDAFAHVNNTVYFRFFESARIAYFERLGFDGPTSGHRIGPILHSTNCRFRLPLTYPDRVSVGARVSDIGDDRFLMHYIVVSHANRSIAADGEGLIVSYDYHQSTKAPLPEPVRLAIRDLEDLTG